MPGHGADLLSLCESKFEEDVLNRLLDLNYRAKPQVAAHKFRIDIVVDEADDRRLAIEPDGDQFHGPDQWEEDSARQAAPKRAGWVFWRVFASQWYSDPEGPWSNLVETMSEMEIHPIGARADDDIFVEYRELDAFEDGLVSNNEHEDSDADTEKTAEISKKEKTRSEAVGFVGSLVAHEETDTSVPTEGSKTFSNNISVENEASRNVPVETSKPSVRSEFQEESNGHSTRGKASQRTLSVVRVFGPVERV